MSDSYVECLVKAKQPTWAKILKVLLIALTVLSCLVMFVFIIFLPVALAAGVGAYFLNMYTDLEYEYLYLDKELSVDKIMAKSKRKRVGTYSLDRMEVFAPVYSYHLDNFKNRQVKEKDYSIGEVLQPDGRYAMYYEGGEKILLSPNEELVKVLSDLKNAGHQIILVSSGAIGMGVGKLNLTSRPTDMPTKQAAAAVGQCELMYTYDRLFTQYNHTVAQILLTGEDIDHSDRRENFQNTIFRLLELGALPIINENDTVATAEIKVGDNDTLGAVVACTVKADLLVLLSDIQGLYTADPRKDPGARLIPVVEEITADIEALAGGAGSGLGTGGMATKLRAARMVTGQGCDMIITNGDQPQLLYDIVEGKQVGTRFLGRRA